MMGQNDAAETLGMITATEAAVMIGVSSATMAGWRKTGRGPAWYRMGNRPVYRRQEVERWIASERNTTRDARPLIEGGDA